ncbi:hypothetical protein [Desulfobacter sp.]|uniref:hypothetical protein n=1 Tax=Desulfobacter sp. TaxID=2294 RepID=UPI003D0B9DC9
MKWMEMIKVLRPPKSNVIEDEDLLPRLKRSLDGFIQNSSLCGYLVVEDAMYQYDLTVLLFWEGQMPMQSVEGWQIKEFLETQGIVDHAVWKSRLHCFTKSGESEK